MSNIRKPFLGLLKLIPNNLKDNLFKILIFSVIGLLGALSLPQFASDRFGIGLIIIFIFLISLFSLDKFKNIDFNFIDLMLILFVLLCFISTFSSYFFKESLIGFFKYFVFFLGYLVTKSIFYTSEKKTMFNIFYGLIIFATITALYGIYQYIIGVEPLATWEDPNAEDLHTRVYSTLGNPNLLAGYLVLCLPLASFIGFKENSNILEKVFSILTTIILITCLIFTGSRGGYIAFICQFFIFLMVLLNFAIKNLNIPRKKVIIAGTIGFILILITIILFAFPVITERLMTIFTLREHSSNSYRVNVWVSCLDMLKDNFLIGVGPGNASFRLSYGLYMVSGFDALGAYNILLEIAIELGFIGVILALLISLSSFIKLHFIFWNKTDFFALGIFISIIGVFIQGIFDTVFFRPQIFIPFLILLATFAKLEKNS